MATDIEHFGFQHVELLKDQPLGRGSYGAVCKARCDELLCAAKVVHPTLFALDDPNAQNIPLEKFQQECRLLCAVKHPNIVQYLGTWLEPGTQHLVLLMELCDESLTRYLERSPRDVAYHIQVNFCHDIALALVYLHTNRLIHRDLSSNNILLVPGLKAKITDFGMSRFMQVNSRLTPLTLCPGTQAYMAPETLDEPPQYTAKLDCFSLGVLAIQIITQKFPDPGARFQTISDPRYSDTISIRVPVPEEERRKSHVSIIDTSHPLLPLIKKCLSYNEEKRPTAVEVYRNLTELKSATIFAESMHASVQPSQLGEGGNPMVLSNRGGSGDSESKESSTVMRKDTDVEFKEHLQQVVSKKKELEALLQTCEQNAKEEIKQRDDKIEELKRKVAILQEKLASSQQVSTSDKQSTVVATKQSTLNSTTPLSWEITGAAPQEVFRGGAVVLGNSLYCHSSGKRIVQKFDLANNAWSTLPQCRYSHFSLAVVNGQLTTIGGYDFTTTDQLFCFAPESVSGSVWEMRYGSMPTARCNSVALCTDSTLVVAGGDGSGYNDYLDVVEVMDTENGKWTAVSKLPSPHLNLSAVVTNNGRLYLAGGITLKGKNATYSCSMADLLLPPPRLGRFRAPKRPPVWHETGSLPVTHTTLVTFHGHLLAIGGQNTDRKCVANVYKYNDENNSWEEFGFLNVPRCRCLAGVVQGRILCIGGQGEDTIEIAVFQ